MGRIKSKLVKKTGNSLILDGGPFTKIFDENKKILLGIMPSKKIRNQVAGFITRKKRTEKKTEKEI